MHRPCLCHAGIPIHRLPSLMLTSARCAAKPGNPLIPCRKHIQRDKTVLTTLQFPEAICSVVCLRCSDQQFGTHFSAIDDFDRSVTGSHQFFVGNNPKAVINRGCPVFYVQRIVFRFAGR